MKRILLTIIACTVVLGVGSFASAKDAPVIEVVKGTAKVLKENATEASPPFGGGPLGTTCRVAN